MEKEYEWKFKENGVPHTILCQEMNNKYVLWVDDKHWKTVYRRSFQHSRGGIDEDMMLLGKPCHFVVWQNESVEFFFDGRSLNQPEEEEETEDASYEESRRRHETMMRRYYWTVVILTALICVAYFVMVLCGKDMSGWTGCFVVALVILIVHLFFLFKKRKG